MAGIYIHIPFCSQACHYCDFHFSTNKTIVNEISQSIALELKLQSEYLAGEIVDTIYFGGGTPSILTIESIATILNSIHKNFSIAPIPEITLEANPEDLTKEKVSSLKSESINRLSIGIQSFDDEVLIYLNRVHSSQAAKKSIRTARDAGFNNLNVDLIYAIPNRDKKKLETDLNTLVELSPEHISAYSLTIEEKTAFGKWAKSGKIKVVSDEENALQFEYVMQFLIQNSYDHYEISNYAKPGFESKHNSSYWKQKKYLGVGPSAHSYNGVSRQFNIANNQTYLKSLRENKIPSTVETLSKEDHINEYLLTSFRTKWGCNLGHLKEKYGYDLMASQKEQVTIFIERGLMNHSGSVLQLTSRGKMHADKLSSDLFLIN